MGDSDSDDDLEVEGWDMFGSNADDVAQEVAQVIVIRIYPGGKVSCDM